MLKEQLGETLKKISPYLKELNPYYDMKLIHIHNVSEAKNPSEKVKMELENLMNLFTTVKPLGRGMVIGGIAGATYNAITGNSPAEGYTTGLQLGAAIDINQYLLQMIYQKFKSDN